MLDWMSAELTLVVGSIKQLLDAPGAQAVKWLLGAFALYFAIRLVYPTWRILALSLYRDLPWSWPRSLVDLLKLGWLGISREKWYQAARLRVEWELLQRRPEPPPRHLALPIAGEGLTEAAKRYDEKRKEYAEQLKNWKQKLAQHLGNFAHADGADVVIPVKNCSQIYARADEIRNYFGVLATDRSTQMRGSDRFVSQVCVEHGFIAPLHLVSGLLAECEDDWEPVIKDYGRRIAQPMPAVSGLDGAPTAFGEREAEYRLQRLQTFLFDCWLLWGPSIPICTCEAWHGGRSILQFGFGDENNSLALIFAKPVSRDELQRFFASDRVHAVKVTGVVGYINWGPSVPSNEVNQAQQSLCKPEEGRLALQIVDWPWLAAGDRTEGYARYYSAYLWLMFVICRPNFEPLYSERTWRGVLPFFEHTNIAEAQTLSTLRHQLLLKTLMTIKDLLHDLPRLHLRFVCAIDDSCCGSALLCPAPGDASIRALLQQLIDSEGAFSELRAGGTLAPRLCLDGAVWRDGEYSSCHLPDLLSAYYAHVNYADSLGSANQHA